MNGGSSSIKFALHAAKDDPVRLLSGKIERIALPDARADRPRNREETAE
jgi:acetate kinase